MQNLKLKSVCGAFAVLFCLGYLNNVNAEERSFFQRFANFFTPTGSVKGEGPIFDELRGVESQIDKIEVQYSRERRPGNKTRYRKQLDSLRNVRDSLITVIEKMPTSSAAVASSSSAKVAQSSAAKSAPSNVAQSSAGAARSSSSALPSAVSSAALSSSAADPATVAASSSANAACVHDTIFVHDTLVVRDTVVIHDTLYVVLANKPKATSKEKKKGAEAPVK
jgi:hypothetical protein